MLRPLAILLLALGSAACSSTNDLEDGGSGGGAGQGGGEGDGESGGGGTGEVGEALDLFACSVVPDCVQDFGHLGEGSTEEDARCSGELATSGEPGAVLTMSQPGPYPTETETLYVLDGEGYVFSQTRSRCGVEGGCEEQNTTAWRRSVLQRCAIDIPVEDVAGCDTDDGVCTWYGRLTACEPVAETWTCGDL